MMYLTIQGNDLYDINGRQVATAGNEVVVQFSYNTFTNAQLNLNGSNPPNTDVAIQVEYYVTQQSYSAGWRKFTLMRMTAPATYNQLAENDKLTVADATYDSFNRGTVANYLKGRLEAAIPGSTVTIVNP